MAIQRWYGRGVNDGKGLYSGMAGGDKADDYIVTASKCSITTTSEFSFTFVPYDYYWCGEKIAFVVSEDCETFETVWSYEFSSETYDGKWQEATINLSAYAGRDLYLGLHHYGTEDGLRADNLKLYSEEPGVPSNFKATATETTVTLTWDAVYGAKSYKVYAVTTEVVEETETTVYTLIKENLKKTTFTIEGLEQGTAYSYSVTSVNEFKESKYASVVTVNTLKEEEPEDPEQPGDDDDSIEELASSFNVYPNPVNNILYIETEMNVEEVVIYDVYGRQQLTVNGQQTVDVANLNSGVYFVKVVANEGEAVKRFIKK